MRAQLDCRGVPIVSLSKDSPRNADRVLVAVPAQFQMEDVVAGVVGVPGTQYLSLLCRSGSINPIYLYLLCMLAN